MSKRNWTEEEIINSLKNMPKLNDKQSPDQLYHMIETKRNARKAKRRLMKVVATLSTTAAAILFFIIVPLINLEQPTQLDPINSEDNKFGNHMAGSSIAGNSGPNLTNGKENQSLNNIGIQSIKRPIILSTPMATNYHGAILGVDANKAIITVAVPNNNGEYVIPLSYIVDKTIDYNKARMLMNVLKDHKNNNYPSFYLNDATFTQSDNGKVLYLNVPKNHKYGEGSASTVLFFETVKSLLENLNFEKAEFTTAGNAGIDLGNAGIIYELKNTHRNLGYYLFEESKETFLVPITLGEKLSFEEALQAMATSKYRSLQSVIPNQTFIQDVVYHDKEVVKILLNERAFLDNSERTIAMIDAIMLTAKSYGFTFVQFEGANITSNLTIGVYRMSNQLVVPKQPNAILE
jgi:hypothetical protein